MIENIKKKNIRCIGSEGGGVGVEVVGRERTMSSIHHLG